MALLAFGAVHPLVHRGFGMTTEAILAHRLERDRRVARRADQRLVRAVDLELRIAVVTEQDRLVDGVALLARRSERALVHVVLLVTPRLAAGRRRVVIDARRVTRRARLDLGVLARERVLRIFRVIESDRRPLARLVTARADLTERALVERVLVTRHAALARRLLIDVVDVAQLALHAGVTIAQRKFRFLAVKPLE